MTTFKERYRKVKPFTRRQYVMSAQALYVERALEKRRELPTFNEIAGLMDELAGLTFDPYYSAKWSAVTRKRSAGLLLAYLYKVADEHQLDMTPVFAQRFLEGCVGRSVSNRLLIRAFSVKGRSAEHKSEDWERLPELIECYQQELSKKLQAERSLMREQLRVTAWERAKAELQGHPLSKIQS